MRVRAKWGGYEAEFLKAIQTSLFILLCMLSSKFVSLIMLHKAEQKGSKLTKRADLPTVASCSRIWLCEHSTK